MTSLPLCTANSLARQRQWLLLDGTKVKQDGWVSLIKDWGFLSRGLLSSATFVSILIALHLERRNDVLYSCTKSKMWCILVGVARYHLAHLCYLRRTGDIGKCANANSLTSPLESLLFLQHPWNNGRPTPNCWLISKIKSQTFLSSWHPFIPVSL